MAGLVVLSLVLPLGAIPVGECAETTSSAVRPRNEAREVACEVLGLARDCPAVAVEHFEANRLIRQLWVVPASESRPSVSSAKARSAPEVDPAAVEALALGAAVGEDALVPLPPRRVACGPLRPRWVDRASSVYWDDAVLVLESRIDRAEERRRKGAAASARAKAEALRAPRLENLPPTRKGYRLVVKGQAVWMDPEGSELSLRTPVPASLESELREHGWHRQDEPAPLPRYVEALMARSPVLEEILAVRGEDAPSPREVASYRLHGEPWRYALLRTNYTQRLLAVPEPTRSRVWAAIHDRGEPAK